MVEERGQLVSERADRVEPRGEGAPALVSEGVRALRRPGEVGAPLGDDEPLLLERAKRAVDVPDVDALVAQQLREALEQLVAVRRPVREEKEQSELAEALDPGAHVPAALRAAADPCPRSSAVMHADSICNLHR
jgi:hypothetical protein